MPNVFVQTYKGTKAILQGMGVVMQHMFQQPFTVEYPEVRRPAPPRTRNRIAFLFDEESEKMRCIGCTSCVVVCPREIIHLKVETVDKKKVVVQFDIDLGDCIGCGNCVEICPVDALELLPDFELAAERKEDLLYDMHKMGKFVQKGYLPAQFFPAKSEPPKPISKNAAPKPIVAPLASAETLVATDTATATAASATATADPATLSPEELKAAARIKTEQMKAAREAAKAAAEGGDTAVAKTPEEIRAAAVAKTAELKAAREAAKAAAEAGGTATAGSAATAPAPLADMTPDEIKEAGPTETPPPGVEAVKPLAPPATPSSGATPDTQPDSDPGG
jgi:NADH-quinone oxidoreductase subunit I